MKRYKMILLILLLACIQYVPAQELMVKSFKLVDGDLTASTEPRSDGNGEPCALIKLHIPDDLVKVEGDIVAPITTIGMEKRIYVPTAAGVGTTVLVFYTSHHQPLKVVFADYISKTLMGKSTYELDISDPSGSSASGKDIGAQYLVMTVEPAGAMVSIDGTPMSLDPDGSLLTMLAYGVHSYSVVAPGYESKSGTVTIGHEKVTIPVTLSSVMATLKVSCPTSGCSIYVNDKLRGTDSWTGPLSAGTYNIEARKERYRSASQLVTLVGRDNKTISFPSLATIAGQINVSYKPANAEVLIDGTKIGTSPDIFSNIMVGSHVVEVRKSGYESARQTVEIKDNTVTDITGSLTPETVSSANASPSGSRPTHADSTNYSKRSGSSSPTDGNIETFTVKGVCFNMVKVSGGTFKMGATSEQDSDASDEEKPLHSVTLSDYLIGETEVTQALWQTVMGSNPANKSVKQENHWGSYDQTDHSSSSGSQSIRFKPILGTNLPVEQVSWKDCQKFISKLNSITGKTFSLPTEAQWEYASRGGNKSHGYKYSGSNDINDVGWCEDNRGNDFLHDVKTKSANELGLYDMSGNVGEWCSDWYGAYSSDSQTNPTGPNADSNHVIRGGSWDVNAKGCRVLHRGSAASDYRFINLGLRLALSE